MADRKVSALTATTTLEDTWSFYAVSSGAQLQITQSNLKADFRSGLVSNVDSAGAILHSDFDATGTIIIGRGAASATTFVVGTDDFVLTADSSASVGVQWKAAAAPGSTFSDSDFRVQDNGDATKQFAFEVSGITTGTTRTWTVPDEDVDLTALKQFEFIPAAAMMPTVSNGCDFLKRIELTAGQPDLNILDFDNTADEHAQFTFVFPNTWNAGTVTFKAHWTAATGGTTGVAIALQGVARGDNEAYDAAYGTAVVVTDDAQTGAHEVYTTAESAAITIAGTPAVGDIVTFRAFRDVSDANDDLAEDMRLLGVTLFWSSDNVVN